MASVEKESVREQFDNLKQSYKDLASKQKVSPEMALVFNGLIALMEIILAIFMERTTKKTSANSSKPSSQTEKDESALTQTGSKGKGKAQNDEVAKNS